MSLEENFQILSLSKEVQSLDKTCPICLNDILEENLAQLKSCQHYFCLGCISTWAKTKLSCPLCKASFNRATISVNGTMEDREFQNPKPIDPKDVAIDLSCLDSTYFLSEVLRLFGKASATKKQYFSNLQKRDYNSIGMHVLNDVTSRLLSYQSVFLRESPIHDPEAVLQDLYRLDGLLKSLSQRELPAHIVEQYSEVDSSRRYGADDDYEDEYEDEEDEEYYYEDY
eukprot:TRINITY_DN645_c0_g1_i4.p1 TRINITY_DN645_c0_g1~~TRINITY_DN645_c0_g1_i4.p1  ORF type:complete len:227 (-),score=36.00 TRINITY_DN645_c0_g1_i4:5-685(-)